MNYYGQGGFFVDHLQARMDYATTSFRTADYEEAKIIFSSLLKVYERQGAAKNICLCLYRLACVAYVRGEMQKFEELFERHEQLALALEDTQIKVEYLVLRGLADFALQRYDQAILQFEQVLMFADSPEFIKQKVSALLYSQKCHLLMEHFDESLHISDLIWRDYAEVIVPDAGQFFHFTLNHANTMLGLGKLEAMDDLLVQCEQHEDFQIMPKEQIQTLVTRAKYHLAKEAPIFSIGILEKALALATEQEDVNVLSEVYEALIETYEMLKQPLEALTFAKKRLNLHKELVKR